MQTLATIVLVCGVPLLWGNAGLPAHQYRAAGTIAAAEWPYLPGSIVPIHVDGFEGPYHVALLGTGTIDGGPSLRIPDNAAPGSAAVIAGNANGIAKHVFRIGTPPSRTGGFVAVASYDDGIVFHDPRTFAALGVLSTGGAPSDVATFRDATLAATDTQGAAIALASLRPWTVRRIGDVPFGDEIATDEPRHAVFVTNRDVNGSGALTRVAPDSSVRRVATGDTSEGLVIDANHAKVYVANVNDGTIAVVDARSMRVERHIRAIARVFSLALSPDGARLYATSNQSTASPFAAPGAAIAIDLRQKPPKIVARSGELTFPLGAALDSRRNTLFVTDESRDVVYVLDARTLAARHAPLPTCRTPWKPTIDPQDERLFVPCARADRVDVFDAASLRRVPGAPFQTGGYPLAVTIFHPPLATHATP